MITESDEALLIKIQQGSRVAFGDLVKRHHKKFYCLAYHYVSNIEEAEDVIQTAFLKLWENPYQYSNQQGAKFTTWFYRVVINLCLDKKKQANTAPLPDNFDITDQTTSQESALINQQNQILLKKHITTLPDRQKTALVLCFYQHLSHQQAASIMGVGIKALESLLSRAKATLKQQMDTLIV